MTSKPIFTTRMYCWSKILSIAGTRLPPCWTCSTCVSRAALRCALCSIKPKDASPAFQSIIAASIFPTSLSSDSDSTSTIIIATFLLSALWIWKNIIHLHDMRDENPPVVDDEIPPASSYAGRWVARLRGRIIAQGGTPEQALHAAQTSRHKEQPEIIYMPVPFSYSPLIDKVRELLPNQEIYLVGGAVRDMLLNRVSHDLDFAVPSNGIALARRVANAINADFMVLDAERDTGRVIVTDEGGSRTYLDFATYRGIPISNSANSIEEDLHARDFTINAVAFNLRTQTILDPLNGASDIRAKIIRACSPTSLEDDPVRILRAIRQAAALGFKIELGTRKTMKQAAPLLPNISPERLRDELFKILEGRKPDASMRALEMLGIFPHLLPELSTMKGVKQSAPHIDDVWEHTLSVLRYLEDILSAL